ncbi:hypothetical protein AAG570_013266 [Ranatra chinensis]|uniref:RNA-directed DNA polymerase n=1 Tax=Ranatra chinensis TaxID=642074 RepID=A0ABD0Z2J0_9HEMI
MCQLAAPVGSIGGVGGANRGVFGRSFWSDFHSTRGKTQQRPILDIHEEVTWNPENFHLSLLGAPKGESLEPPGLGLLRRRVEEGPDLPAIPVAAARVTPVSRPESERRSAECRELLWERGSLNDKARQLDIEIVPGTNVRTSCHRYGRTRTWTVTIGQQATNRDVQTTLDAILETNHREIRETVALLRRRYYWMGMERTVTAQLALCVVCAGVKYVRTPEEPPQMVTPTPKKPMEVVEADVVFLDGTIRLTMIDRLTRFSACYPLAAKTGEQVRGALLLFLATVGTPGTLVLDQGREFRNWIVRGILEEFRIRVHWTTPGHPRSHWMVERLHSILLKHLHLLRIGRGIEGDEAWARALLAHNNSVHTPLELMLSWQQTDPPVSVMDECEGLVEADERRKIDRVDRANEEATNRWDRVRVGDQVFLLNWY